MTRRDWYALVFYVALAVATGFTDHRIRRFPDHALTQYIPGVVDGSAEAPGRYRVLAPMIIDATIRATGATPLVVFLIWRLVFIYGALATMHLYLRRWFSETGALAGTLALAGLLPLTFTNSWSHPDSMLELLLFTAGCWAIVRGRDAWLAAVVIVSAFNRETSVFLLMVWALHRLVTRPVLAEFGRVAALGAAWTAIFIGLRVVRGYASYEYWMLPYNLAVLTPLPANFDPYVRVSGYMWLVLTVPLFAFAIIAVRRLGWRSYFASALAVASLLMVVGFTISSVIESRIFTPLFPLLLPAALAGLGVEHDRVAGAHV